MANSSKIVIRPVIVAAAATVEKRMQEVLDGKINLRKEPDTTKFRRGIMAQTETYVKMVEKFEDQGDPEIDLQQIQLKMADAMIMLLSTLEILMHKQNQNQ
jgi:hypothetical protein